jgi:hypothetical protein
MAERCVYRSTRARLNGALRKLLPSVCVYLHIYPTIAARQRLSKHIPEEKKYATQE